MRELMLTATNHGDFLVSKLLFWSMLGLCGVNEDKFTRNMCSNFTDKNRYFEGIKPF